MSRTDSIAAEFSDGSWRQNPVARYVAPFAITGIALLVWMLWPVMHSDPFAIFIAAVIVGARFFGFIPALLCTGLSSLTLAFLIFPPTPDMRISHTEAERLVVFIIVSVITAGLARKRSQAETRAGEMRGRMAAIVESSDDAILSATAAGNITSWNPGAQALYGYSEEEALGRHIAFLAPIEKTREVSRHLARIRKGEHVTNYQTEHLRKNGSRVLVQLSISPLRSGQTVAGASAIVRDITAEKQSEEALRKNEKLSTAGRMAATLAHEINNPLEALGNLLYLARHGQARRDEYLRLAEKEVERISSITRFALGFIRESHDPVLLNVPEMIDQILSLYSAKLTSGDIAVEKEYGPSTNVQGYSGELRQLFANLLINSVDAMKRGGKLRIHVSHGHEWGAAARDGVRIFIADTGTGIHPGEMAHLFEPFYTTKKDLGTGLGLWISQGIVQKHGGSIRVRSRISPGRSGTVFSIFLPGVVAATAQAVA
jgi:PAS domain S-box-containing protein